MRRPRTRALLPAVALAGALTAAALTGAPVTSPAHAATLPRPAHVVVVVLENHRPEQVVDAVKAPWLNGLPALRLTNAHGVRHPSQPNYLALFSGSTQGVTDDSCPHTFTGENLGHQLRAAGLHFAGFAEALPASGSTACSSGTYRRKHAPWVDFSNVPAWNSQPFSAFPTDYTKLPTVAFVVPDLCHDMHDCSVTTGDTWLREHLSGYVTWAATHNSLLVVTFDEDDYSTSDNRIPVWLVGPMVTPGTSGQRADHYTLLRTLEDLYGLPALGTAGSRTALSGFWR